MSSNEIGWLLAVLVAAVFFAVVLAIGYRLRK